MFDGEVRGSKHRWFENGKCEIKRKCKREGESEEEEKEK